MMSLNHIFLTKKGLRLLEILKTTKKIYDKLSNEKTCLIDVSFSTVAFKVRPPEVQKERWLALSPRER
jgi:hypothetical protein